MSPPKTFPFRILPAEGFENGAIAKQIEKRPALLFFFGLVLGLVALKYPISLLVLIPTIVVCRSVWSLGIFTFAMGVGLVIAPPDLPILTTARFSPNPIQILSPPYATARDMRCDGLIGTLRVRVVLPAQSLVHYGDLLKGGVIVGPVPDDQEIAYREDGLQGLIRMRKVQVLRTGPTIFAVADSFRAKFDDYLSSYLDQVDRDWLEALWLRTRTISDQDEQAVMSSGAYSFVSASGLQVYLLFAIVVGFVGGLLRLDRRIQILIALAVLLFYWVVTGLHGNTLRATLTCVAFASAYLFKREPDVASAAALAGILFLLLSARAVFTLGFQLSMLIPISVGLCFQSGGSRHRWIDAAKITAICVLAGQPLIAVSTGKFGIGQVLTTVLLGWVTVALLGASLFGFCAYILVRSLGRGILIALVGPLTAFFRESVSALGSLGLQWTVPAFAPYWLVLYYGLWIFGWREQRRPVPAQDK